MQITTSVSDASGESDGAVTVGARKLQEILRSLPETAEVSLILDDRRMQVKSGKSRFNLQTLPADDFPCMALSKGETKKVNVSQKQFRRLLAQTQYSMATQDVRYYLNGMLLETDGKFPRSTVLCANDRIAFGVIGAAYQMGLRVGHGNASNLRVAGHDDDEVWFVGLWCGEFLAGDEGADLAVIIDEFGLF